MNYLKELLYRAEDFLDKHPVAIAIGLAVIAVTVATVLIG